VRQFGFAGKGGPFAFSNPAWCAFSFEYLNQNSERGLVQDKII
jgi:hypothetical protein